MLLFFILTALVAHISSQTIGNAFARAGQFPYLVVLMKDGAYNCGGSIISETFILTAGQCVFKTTTARIQVRAGINNLSSSDGQFVDAEEFIIHPEFNHKNLSHDIALIKLSTPLKLTADNINKIELSSVDLEVPNHTMGTIVGFAAINSAVKPSEILKYANIEVWSRQFCSPDYLIYDTDLLVCAGDPTGVRRSCPGDIGGPLILDNKLYGVVSFGFGCGAPGLPVVYTYVPAYRSWIEKYVDLNVNKEEPSEWIPVKLVF